MKRYAFTLIELLIVVAIIAILAAIAVPNFLEAQTRSKVSRAKSDMRTLATAIEAYQVDNNRYPPVTSGAGATPGPGYNIFPGNERVRGLTTPIAYITSLLGDPFNKISAEDLYQTNTENYYYATQRYFNNRGFIWQVFPGERGLFPAYGTPAQWVLQSKGPDLAWARDPSDGGAGVIELDRPYSFEYDPSNGTVSTGNIPRSGATGVLDGWAYPTP